LLVDLADQELVRAVERPKSHVVRVIEGFETVMFRSKFESWPQTTNVTVSEDGRGKVAGQQLNYLIDLILVSCFHS
jgi:gelsolin